MFVRSSLFAACKLKPSWLINRLPGVLNDLAQVTAFTFSCMVKSAWCIKPHSTDGKVSTETKTIRIALLLRYYFVNTIFFYHSRCCFYSTNTTTSQVKHLHCYEAFSIQPSQLLQKCKHLLIQEIF